jgi:hypothetical protein
MAPQELSPSNRTLEAVKKAIPEVRDLFFVIAPMSASDWSDQRKNPYQVIKIGREIAEKLTGSWGTEDQWTPLQRAVHDNDALLTATAIYKTRMNDPLRLSSFQSIDKDDPDVKAIISEDAALKVYAAQMPPDAETLEKLLDGKLRGLPPPESFFTSGKPPMPDEAKIRGMRQVAAGILLFVGYEAARTASTSGIAAEDAIDALAFSMGQILNTIYLARPPYLHPEVVEGVKEIMTHGSSLYEAPLNS